jgi:hypothetical protein
LVLICIRFGMQIHGFLLDIISYGGFGLRSSGVVSKRFQVAGIYTTFKRIVDSKDTGGGGGGDERLVGSLKTGLWPYFGCVDEIVARCDNDRKSRRRVRLAEQLRRRFR